jgi:hypothetical protein
MVCSAVNTSRRSDRRFDVLTTLAVRIEVMVFWDE